MGHTLEINRKEMGTGSNFLLKETLPKNDYLIDQIVYRLYGLTEEEVKIVEEQK